MNLLFDHFEKLIEAPDGIKKMRELILQLAVQGKLVPQDDDLPAPQPGKYWVYVVKCSNDSIYIGQTENLRKRWEEHLSGKGADWTRKYPPKYVLYWEELPSREEAVKREKWLKTGFGRKWIKREEEAGRLRCAGEPAGLLLKKIKAEKQKLIAEGKIKKHKPLPPIQPEEIPYKVPTKWEWTKLGFIGIIGSSIRVHQKDWRTSGIPFYRAREIVKLSEQGFVNNELFIDEILYNKLSRNGIIPETNDLMITGVGTIGVPYIVKSTDNFYFKDASVLIFKNIFKLYQRYLYYFFRSPLWKNSIHKSSMGTTVHTLTINRAKNTILPFPPLNEQHRIVAKVDQLMMLCDELEKLKEKRDHRQLQMNKAALFALLNSRTPEEFAGHWQRIVDHFGEFYRTPENVAELKKAILQLAVQGKLVPQDDDLPAPQPGKYWVYVVKCSNDSNYIGQTENLRKRWEEHLSGKGADWTRKYPPKYVLYWEELPSREEAVKREKWLKTGFGRKWIKREEEAGRLRCAGEPASVLLKKIKAEKQKLIAEGKIKKEKPLPPIQPDEIPYEIPKGWVWCRIGHIQNFINGYTFKSSDYSNSGRGILRIGDIVNGEISKNRMVFIEESKILDIDDRILVKKGDLVIAMSGATTGKLGFNKLDEVFYLNQRVGKLDLIIVNKYYLYFYLTTKIQENLQKSFGSAIPNLSTKQINDLLFPLPPLNEQHRIVAKVDQLMALCDELEKGLTKSRARLEKALGSVVNGVGNY